MNEQELIEKIRNADLNEVNQMALEHSIRIGIQCQRGKLDSDIDYGLITLELCARKKELTESKEAGEAYRKHMVTRHLATADEFLDLSVEDGILSEQDAQDIRENRSETLNRLYNVEKRISLEWITRYGNKIQKEK